MLERQPTISLIFAALLTVVNGDAFAQQFATPGQLQYGGQPVMQVAPDGAVHLDGPMSSYSMPSNASQPALIAQNQPGIFSPQAPATNRFGNWLFNNPIPYQYEHRSGLFGEFLFIRPRNAEVAYALPIDGPVAPVLGNEVPVGPAAVVDFGYEPAFRVGFSLRLQPDSSISAQYTNFRGEDSDAVTVVAPIVLRSLVSHPLSMNAATDTLDARASLGIEYDLVDVDFKALLDGCEPCETDNCGNSQSKFADVLNYIVGVRYARLDQDFRSAFVTTGTTSVDTNVDFDGGGIRLGLEGERHSTATGLYVYGQGLTNLMVGEFKADYAQINTFNGTEAITSWSGGRLVPGFDLELGFGWVAPRRRLRLSTGYMVSTWFNVVKTEDFIDAAQTHDFDNMSSILTFDGLVTRAEWEF